MVQPKPIGYVPIQGTDFNYIGGFYYERGTLETDESAAKCLMTTHAELNQIDDADVVVIVLDAKSAIATVTELMYAVSKQKRTVIFYDPNLAGYDITKEYWFPLIAATRVHPHVDIRPAADTYEIVRAIMKL
jgi:nucleoside 2-deoxyribosyltransferase